MRVPIICPRRLSGAAETSQVKAAIHENALPNPSPKRNSDYWGPKLAANIARDTDTNARLEAAGVEVVRPPQTEPWGLTEMWIADPDGVDIVLVEVPDDHPLRRDQR